MANISRHLKTQIQNLQSKFTGKASNVLIYGSFVFFHSSKTLAPQKESYDELSVLKSRDITSPAKLCLVNGMAFPVVMYGCESWTIKKAEHQSTDAFKLWCWRRLLRVLWTTRRSNQSILKEISPEYSLEGLMLKLNLQCFGHLMQKADSQEKTLMLGKTEGRRRR